MRNVDMLENGVREQHFNGLIGSKRKVTGMTSDYSLADRANIDILETVDVRRAGANIELHEPTIVSV
jgi:hypothetical protein